MLITMHMTMYINTDIHPQEKVENKVIGRKWEKYKGVQGLVIGKLG